MPITDIINTIVHPSAASTKYGDTTVEQLPITHFIADLIARMNWDPDMFAIYRDNGTLCFSVGPEDEATPTCIHGYKYGWQVKLVMDAIEIQGLFN